MPHVEASSSSSFITLPCVTVCAGFVMSVQLAETTESAAVPILGICI